jgi:hypothetical protein
MPLSRSETLVTFDKATTKHDGPKKVEEGKSITRAIGRGGLENFDFLGPKWHSLRSLPLQGLKKSLFQGLTLPTALLIDFPYRLFKAQMALPSLVSISGPKKRLDFQGPPIPIALVIDIAHASKSLRPAKAKHQVH